MPDGTKRVKIRPQLSSSARTVIAGMADIYGYAHQAKANQNSVLTLRCTDGSIECGGRLKYLPYEISMSYDNLAKALEDAIDKEAQEHNGEFVTNDKLEPTKEIEYNYEELIDEFKQLTNNLMTKNPMLYGTKITKIVEKYLGKGKKVAESNPDQAEHISLIVDEIKEELME